MARAVHINGREYTYRINRQTVWARTPEGQTVHVHQSQLVGVTPDEIDRARWKGSAYRITPSIVKAWLMERIGEVE